MIPDFSWLSTSCVEAIFVYCCTFSANKTLFLGNLLMDFNGIYTIKSFACTVLKGNSVFGACFENWKPVCKLTLLNNCYTDSSAFCHPWPFLNSFCTRSSNTLRIESCSISKHVYYLGYKTSFMPMVDGNWKDTIASVYYPSCGISRHI